ncbi:MAG TPA: DUF4136 domain-containing protein [Gemmatimonadaceae bacterium]|nr:DUF4136 domain-containing protein [Gemmatimonadaceae bacterium]
MNRNLLLGVVSMVAFGCAPAVRVETNPSPSETFSRDRTFRFLSDAPESETPRRAVRSDIARALGMRGYAETYRSPDLFVDYSLAMSQHLDVRYDDFQDPSFAAPPKWGFWPERQVTVVVRATLTVAVLDGDGKRLLWRGTGTMDMPDDPNDEILALDHMVEAVMQKFPGYPTAAPWPKSVAVRAR